MQKVSNKVVALDKLYLDLNNPRHTPYVSEKEVIDYLCKNEDIVNLAKDIALHGLNPLENLAVVEDDKTQTYIVVEGNRRLCAIKLLNDFKQAPKDLQKKFSEISRQWQEISELQVIVLEDEEHVDLWLSRIHAGLQKGVGRKSWDAEQKTRHFKDGKNSLALAILDIAEENNLIDIESKKGKLSIVQRFATNKDFKEALSITNLKLDTINLNKLKIFINDLINENIDTRSHSTTEQISQYVKKKLIGIDEEVSRDKQVGLKNEKEELQSGLEIQKPETSKEIQQELQDKENKILLSKQKSNEPEPQLPTKLPNPLELDSALNKLNNYKLKKLYYSIHEISLKKHTPILTIGIWSFLETLTLLHGRENVEFSAYINQHLQKWGFTSKQDKAIKEAVKRFHENGNATKHHATAATFNAEQLLNDFEVISPLLVAITESIIKKQ